METKKILVTTDFSEVSYAALSYVAEKFEDQVTILSVVPSGDVPPDLLKQMPNPNAVQEYREGLIQQMKDKLSAVSEKYFSGKPVQVEIDTVVGHDDVASDICQYAEDNAIDMIVMTSQGRGVIGSLIIGSTVQKVLRMSKVPVLVIPKSA